MAQRSPSDDSVATVALIGNPNTGKSTLFSALCGVRQRTGNYPGVTVEKKEGKLTVDGQQLTVIDLPGTYSLAPRSPDEMVAVDVLLGRRSDTTRPNAVVCIVDASNLERNLYVVSQVMELGRPVVIALNMIDVAQSKGVKIDVERLASQLGVPVVPIQAHRKQGLDELRRALMQAIQRPPHTPASPFPEVFQAEVASLERFVAESGARRTATASGSVDPAVTPPPRYLLERLLLDSTGYLEGSGLEGIDEPLLAQVREARGRLAAAGAPVPGVEAMARYQWIHRVLAGVIVRPTQRPKTWSDRVDRVLTQPVFGTLFFVLLMAGVFEAVFRINEPGAALIDAGLGWLTDVVQSQLSEGPLRSLIVKGMIQGVGGVLVFLPQILALFFFIGILEDCGYMARAAYLMDRLMSRIGLSGKSFIPLLSSFACAIPGIMATRVIENSRDRLVTILVAPLMSCSARLPVYTLLIAAFIPSTRYLHGLIGLQTLTMFGLYGLGVLAAVVVAGLLKKTLLRGETPPFVMELPSYKAPSPTVVGYRMLERGWSFVYRAGTLICAVSILVWAAAYYPHDPASLPAELRQRHAELSEQLALRAANAAETPADKEAVEPSPDDQLAEEYQAIDRQVQGTYLQTSYLGRAGKWIEPLVRPLGWDWRIGCAAIASFPAREVVVTTLGVVYNLGEEQTEESEELHDTLRSATWDGTDRKVFTVPTALSIMVFFALCAQCSSTLVVIKRETNSWRWPLFTFFYMTTLAYLGAFATYVVGTWLGW